MSNNWQDASKVDLDDVNEKRELAENIRSVFSDHTIDQIEKAMSLAMSNDPHRGRVYVALKTVRQMQVLANMVSSVKRVMKNTQR